MSLDSSYRYNPLSNDLDAYALAYGIASLLNNLYGRGKEPFWQQAYTNLVKFVILLHKVLYDYVTLFDVYQGAINPTLLEEKIKEGEARFATDSLLIGIEDFLAHPELEAFPFERDDETNRMIAPATEDARTFLESRRIPYEIQTEHGVAATGEPPFDVIAMHRARAGRRRRHRRLLGESHAKVGGHPDGRFCVDRVGADPVADVGHRCGDGPIGVRRGFAGTRLAGQLRAKVGGHRYGRFCAGRLGTRRPAIRVPIDLLLERNTGLS